MSKLLAIDWDNKELRYALAEAGGGRLRSVKCVEQTWDAAEKAGLVAGSFEAVTMLLRQERLAGACGRLLARREHFETFSFAVPFCAHDDLPDLVENHITVEQTLGTEALVYDFVTVEEDSEAHRRVNAVAMSQDVAGQYRELAAAARLKRPRLLLRADGSASIFADLQPENKVPTLLVVPIAEEVDLVVVADGKARYWRTIHCSTISESTSFRDFLVAELKRTEAVVCEELPASQRIQRVATFVAENEAKGVVSALRQALDLPFDQLPAAPQNVTVIHEPEVPTGKFAPLMGALVGAAADEVPNIDLFRQRRRSKSPLQRRPKVMLVAATVIAALLGIYWMWDQVDQAQSETRRLASELKKYEQEAEKFESADTTLADLVVWQQGGMVWLDELRDLTLKFAPAGDAVVLDFSASPNPNGGATIHINGRTRDPAVVTQLDQSLRDEHRVVLSDNFREESASAEALFGWRFESVITTLPRSPAEYRKALREYLSSQSVSLTLDATTN